MSLAYSGLSSTPTDDLPNDRWNVPNPEFALRIYQHKGETLLEWGNKRPVELDPT